MATFPYPLTGGWEAISVEENDAALRRLTTLLKLPERDLFTSPEEMVERAYDVQGDRIAFSLKDGKGFEENGRET